MINQYALTPDQAGGTRHFFLAKELQKRGHEVAIIAGHDRPGLRSGETVVHDGVRFVWLKTLRYQSNGIARLLGMMEFAARVRSGGWHSKLFAPELILGSSPQPFSALASERLARSFGVPFVLEVRDLWPQSLIDIGGMSPRHPFIRLLDHMQGYLYRRASHIVTLLVNSPGYIVEHGGDPDRITWVPNGVDTNVLTDPVPLAEHQDTFTVIYAGRHNPGNDLMTVVEAATLLRDRGDRRLHFRLFGAGSERTKLIETARSRGLSNIEFCDPVPKAQIHDELVKADAFLLTIMKGSTFVWGVSPNKLFDYMAAERPVLFSVDSPNNPVEASKCGMVAEPSNPRALADAAVALANLPVEERRSMAARGRSYVLAHHTPSALCDRLEAALLKALPGKAATAKPAGVGASAVEG